MNQKNIDKLVTEALAIEAREAKEAGALGYMARTFVQAAMPHSQIEGNEFTRTNGDYTLSILAPSAIGIPYGTIPRLIISWITTEAVRTKERELLLGDSLSKFMGKLGMLPTGGKWGSITNLRKQAKRLFSSTISCSYSQGNSSIEQGFRIADAHLLWWETGNSEQWDKWSSEVILTEAFFNEIINRPVPIDMRAIKSLKNSALALDIYCWLTYRMSYLKRATPIPWEALQTQFGAGYPVTSQGKRDFKKKFLHQLKRVLIIYGGVRVEIGICGLILKPSRTHIKYG